MDACDVLIVGAGPAGSSCAWGLRQRGFDVAIMDKRVFPRDKTCGGWITPAVLSELQIDPLEYARKHVFQPITGFRTGIIGGPEVQTGYGRPISYGIRRFEFDEFLLRRCGARVVEGVPLASLERSGDAWIANGQIKARLVIGAGGHFCPVARHLGANARNETAVAAQEIEFEMTASQRERCSIREEVPELYFCPDMKGYGWCFRKKNFLNIGLGRLDPHSFPSHVSAFAQFLSASGKLSFALPSSMSGHAYLLFRESKRTLLNDGILLVGDAAGLAYSQSGEGILPAIESGLLAAEAIVAADGNYSAGKLERYRDLLHARFGKSGKDFSIAIGSHLPDGLVNVLARVLLASAWFSRHVILDRWFLHRNGPALSTR